MKARSNAVSIDCQDMSEEHADSTYRQQVNPYLKDSNAYGNIYFARYFEWQGICRETWFSEHIMPDMFELEGALVTKYAHNDYEEEVLPFQKLECYLNTRHVKQASFELVFRFYNRETGRLVSRGSQKVALLDAAEKKPKKFPPNILAKIRLYEIK